MRTAIRDLGWLFLFLGGLKSLMGLYGTYHHKLHNHHKTHNHQPPTSSLPQTKRRTAITGSPPSIVI